MLSGVIWSDTEQDLNCLPPDIKRSKRSRVSEGLSPQGELRSAGRLGSRGGSPDSSVDSATGCHRRRQPASERPLGAGDGRPCAEGIVLRLPARRPDCPESKWSLLRETDTGGTAAARRERRRRSRKAGD